MVIIITPKRGWRRELQVVLCSPGQAFERFVELNDQFSEVRGEVDISLQHIGVDQVQDWIANNVDPNWYEILTGRIRYALWTVPQ